MCVEEFSLHHGQNKPDNNNNNNAAYAEGCERKQLGRDAETHVNTESEAFGLTSVLWLLQPPPSSASAKPRAPKKFFPVVQSPPTPQPITERAFLLPTM